MGAKKALSTVSINCETYNGWYAAGSDTINWDQGVYDDYSQISDSIYIKLNHDGDYVSGGYLYENTFFEKNNYCNGCINENLNNCEWSETPVEGKTKQSNYGSYDQDENGILEYFYCEKSDQYEISGYKMAANGNTVDFIWYPNGTNSVNYIGEVILNKVSKAPNEDELDAAKQEYETQTFIERHGNWFEFSESQYNENEFTFPKYVYLTDDSVSGYNQEDVLLDTYSEIEFTDREVLSTNEWNNNRSMEWRYSKGNCSENFHIYTYGTVNEPIIRFHFIKYIKDDDDNCSHSVEGAHYAYGIYEPIEDPNITIN